MSDQSTSQNSIVAQTPQANSAQQAPAAQSAPAQTQSFSWPDNWKEHIPDDLKNEGVFKSINTVPDLMKSYVHANKLIGADKIAKPSKYWKEEELKKWYTENLGLPESPDKYEIPDDVKVFDEPSLKDFKSIAHKHNLMPDQVKGVLSWYKGLADKSKEALQADIEKDRTKSIESLKSEWKQDYEPKLKDVQNLFAMTADEETVKWVNETGIGNDPRFIKWVNKLTPLLKEDTLRDGGTSGFVGKEDIMNKIREIRDDSKHPYNDRWHPDHDVAVAQMQELYKKIHSG